MLERDMSFPLKLDRDLEMDHPHTLKLEKYMDFHPHTLRLDKDHPHSFKLDMDVDHPHSLVLDRDVDHPHSLKSDRNMDYPHMLKFHSLKLERGMDLHPHTLKLELDKDCHPHTLQGMIMDCILKMGGDKATLPLKDKQCLCRVGHLLSLLHRM